VLNGLRDISIVFLDANITFKWADLLTFKRKYIPPRLEQHSPLPCDANTVKQDE